MATPSSTTFLLHFVEGGAVLCDNLELPISALGLPAWVKGIEEGECLLLRPRKWDATTGVLSVLVVEYQPTDLSHAKPLPPQLDHGALRSINFMNLNTEWLVKVAQRAPKGSKLDMDQEEPRTVELSFRPHIKDLIFRFGSIASRHFVEEINDEMEVSVANACVRPEFDAIKNYFEKVLGKKRVTLRVQLTLQGKKVVNAIASSPDLEKINEETLGAVKFEFVKKGILRRQIFGEVDSNLHTLDDLFTHTPEREAGKGFFRHEMELFEMLNVPAARHYAQLRYLSGRHDHTTLKLRFVLEPFSFIFLLTGENGYHLVWETLNTEEATYVWQMEKRKDLLKLRLVHVEGVLNAIKAQGKLPYLQSQDEGFTRILHEYDSPDKGFVKWKHQLDALIF